MEPLRIPKRPLPVEFVMLDGAAQSLSVFLADAAEDHAGRERLSDLLAGADAFLPAVEEDSGALVCVNLFNVLLVRAAPEADAGGAEENNLPTEHELDALLVNGSTIRGLATYLQPPERSRLSDHLNDRRPFLRLLDGAQFVFVNKRHIVRVVPVGS